jgi:hypothetical protein
VENDAIVLDKNLVLEIICFRNGVSGQMFGQTGSCDVFDGSITSTFAKIIGQKQLSQTNKNCGLQPKNADQINCNLVDPNLAQIKLKKSIPHCQYVNHCNITHVYKINTCTYFCHTKAPVLEIPLKYVHFQAQSSKHCLPISHFGTPAATRIALCPDPRVPLGFLCPNDPGDERTAQRTRKNLRALATF